MTTRLVYRGSILLPDSDLVLDGLTFSAMISAQATLLDNPLALSLESLRGIPLRFVSMVALSDIYYDTKTVPQIALHVHPHATLSTVYLSRVFCLDAQKALNTGVRVALGDIDETNIVVYASKTAEDTVQLFAARITPPPSILPRPDDPTPRKPPPMLLKGRDTIPSRSPIVKSATTANLAKPANPLKRSRSEFKVPADPQPDLERQNKDRIRDVVTTFLPADILPKSHPDYKETYQMMYRGVMFALRVHMKVRQLKEQEIAKLARVHADMYIGNGPSNPAEGGRSRSGMF
ncbi:hypothetical protein CYLTODRAFT_423535 [Cylindrobasidium torrendii FP15055 ss-10]|uniref:Sld7 C-terminal domain-containing protein n=1 Tax=Cylindrobasidium torrendii FP15055 ss-10 TaxID=1314674 RepID=A0A0D7B829_9AGAR|nr:hypothetical protein CYLTODRAFT_423535 [Cylindrobasidium torrendii FP15055 ss-10]